MRKIICLLLVFSIMLSCSAAYAWTDSNAELYENAIGLLKENKYAQAGEAFAALGSYNDAPRYMMYCNAIVNGEAGRYSVAVENLKSLNDFLDSSILAAYYAGRSWEAVEEYELALEHLQGISLYRDVASRIADYPELINARDYERADADEAAGKLDAAYSAFLALGDYKDSRDRAAALLVRINERDAAEAEAARAAAYAEADRAEKEGDFEKAYEGFVALGDYSDSRARAEAVRQQAQYAKGMSLIAGGSYKEAYSVFKQLGDFEDSASKVYALGLIDFASMKRLDATTAAYQFHEKYGVINFSNNKVVIPQWDEVYFVDSNCLKVKVKDLYGLIDCNGNELSPCKWYNFSKIENGVMVAAVQNKDEASSTKYRTNYQYEYFLVDNKGNTLTPAYKAIGENKSDTGMSISLVAPVFSSGLIRAQNSDGKWGFIDPSGAVRISMVYADANDFSCELAAVKDDRWGYINTSGEYVIEPQFAHALDFNSNERAEVRSRTSWHVIDKSGGIVYFEGQPFDEMPEGGEADYAQIIDVLANEFGVEADGDDVAWLIYELAFTSEMNITSEEEEAMYIAATAGDAEAVLAAIEDIDAFVQMWGIG